MKNDLVIFGATGFTGQRVVEELVSGRSKYPGVSWAVAGRSESKVLSVLKDVSSRHGVDLTHIKVIIADVGDYESLKAMCERAQIVVNCCGPYRLYGEPVVRAAIAAKTHYLDITGEEDFIASTQLKYDEEARQAGVYVISACGFDSIPNDMGVVFLEKNFKGTLNSVESYLSIWVAEKYQKEAKQNGFVNLGTWESMVYVFQNFITVLKLRNKITPKDLPTLKPKLNQRLPIHKYDGKWALPIPTPDGSIVHRSQTRLYQSNNKRPVQFQPYLALPSFFYLLVAVFTSLTIAVLANFKYGRDLLLSKPNWFSFGVVSKGPPSQAIVDNTHFTFELVGRGWDTGQNINVSEPKKTVVAKISGTDPAYKFTSMTLLQSAVTILKEKNKMPLTGGVLSTAAAFYNTSLVDKLQKNDVQFTIQIVQ